MKKKKSKWRGFILAMLIYAVVVLIGAMVFYRYFWDYIADYENALPSHKMDSYAASLTENRVKYLSAEFVASLDHRIMSEDESYSEIYRCFVSGVKYKKISAESSDDLLVYAINNSERQLGRVTLVRNEGEKGDKTWSVDSEEYDFSFLLNSMSFVVPEEWSVVCDGGRIGVECITQRRIEYPFISELYSSDIPLPYLAEYTLSNYVGTAHPVAYEPDGTPREIVDITDGRAQLRRVGKGTNSLSVNFADSFIPLYVACLANTNQNPHGNYNAIRPYVTAGSDLDKRLNGAVYGQVFAQSRRVDIKNIEVNGVYDIGAARYLIDVSYTVDTYSDKGLTTVSTDMFIVVNNDDETFKAELVSLY